MPAPLGVKFDKGRQTVLCKQVLTHVAVILHHAGTDDSPIGGIALLHQSVHIPGKVGTVEIANADMNDTGCEPAAVIARQRGCPGQIGKGGIAQWHGAGFLAGEVHQLIHCPPSTL